MGTWFGCRNPWMLFSFYSRYDNLFSHLHNSKPLHKEKAGRYHFELCRKHCPPAYVFESSTGKDNRTLFCRTLGEGCRKGTNLAEEALAGKHLQRLCLESPQAGSHLSVWALKPQCRQLVFGLPEGFVNRFNQPWYGGMCIWHASTFFFQVAKQHPLNTYFLPSFMARLTSSAGESPVQGRTDLSQRYIFGVDWYLSWSEFIWRDHAGVTLHVVPLADSVIPVQLKSLIFKPATIQTTKNILHLPQRKKTCTIWNPTQIQRKCRQRTYWLELSGDHCVRPSKRCGLFLPLWKVSTVWKCLGCMRIITINNKKDHDNFLAFWNKFLHENIAVKVMAWCVPIRVPLKLWSNECTARLPVKRRQWWDRPDAENKDAANKLFSGCEQVCWTRTFSWPRKSVEKLRVDRLCRGMSPINKETLKATLLVFLSSPQREPRVLKHSLLGFPNSRSDGQVAQHKIVKTSRPAHKRR